jgi:alpha-beta hydrolase superfamily lysophospholipase
MAGWARGRLITLPGIRHEALMEAAALRMARVDEITEFFAQNT